VFDILIYLQAIYQNPENIAKNVLEILPEELVKIIADFSMKYRRMV